MEETDVMERPCAVARGKDINTTMDGATTFLIPNFAQKDQGPREPGVPLNAPMEETFFSTAALLVHTKVLWLFHSQDQRGPSPLVLLALPQGRANALYKSYHAGT
jgi:hypothetical protein